MVKGMTLCKGELQPRKKLPEDEQADEQHGGEEVARRFPHALCRDEEQSVSVLQMLVALELWRQCGLVTVEDQGERMRLTLLPANGKADLTQTPLWRYLERRETDGTP